MRRHEQTNKQKLVKRSSRSEDDKLESGSSTGGSSQSQKSDDLLELNKSPSFRKQKQTEICKYQKRDESLPEILAKLASVDRFPITRIVNCEFIRAACAKMGLKLPKCERTVMKLIKKQFNVTRQEVIADIRKQLQNGGRFSVSLDEWTSVANIRYMNVNVHSGQDFYNLGLAEMGEGSYPADRCLDLLREKLAEFEVSLGNHVVGIVSDGATVMKKMGRLSGNVHQLCYTHAIHLAVCDIIYKKAAAMPDTELDDEELPDPDTQEQETLDVIPSSLALADAFDEDVDENMNTTGDVSDDPDTEDEIGDETDEDEEEQEGGGGGRHGDDGNAMFEEVFETAEVELAQSLSPVIKRVRDTVRKFKKSAKKTASLRK